MKHLNNSDFHFDLLTSIFENKHITKNRNDIKSSYIQLVSKQDCYHTYNAVLSGVHEDIRSIILICNERASLNIINFWLKSNTDKDQTAPISIYTNLKINTTDRNVSIFTLAQALKNLRAVPQNYHVSISNELQSDYHPSEYKRFQERNAIIVSHPFMSGWVKYEIGDDIKINQFLSEWATPLNNRKPLLLLGDRGTGKTFQGVNYFHSQFEKEWTEQGKGLIIYIHLGRGGLSDNITGEGMNRSNLLLHIFEKQKIKYKFDYSMFLSMLSSGYITIFFDGFDEIAVHATDDDIEFHLSFIARALPASSKYIISCRTTHFRSWVHLLNIDLGSKSVEEHFEVIELNKFNEIQSSGYLGGKNNNHELDHFISILTNSTTSSSNKLYHDIFKVLCSQPSLLSAIHSYSTLKNKSPLEIIRYALEENIILFNIEADRTSDIIIENEGGNTTFKKLGLNERVRLLADISWWLSLSDSNAIDLASLPPRLAAQYGITRNGLYRDIRSQTLFKLSDKAHTKEHVHFSLRVDKENSIAQSYFLAKKIMSELINALDVNRLFLSKNLTLATDDLLKYLGSISLDKYTALFITDMIKETELKTGKKIGEAIRNHAIAWIKEAATSDSLIIFSNWAYHLFPNLYKIKLITINEKRQYEPWNSTTVKALDKFLVTDNQKLALIPYKDNALLLGVSEVTNKNYTEFLSSDLGEPWRVENSTLAGSGNSDNPPSKYFHLTNEYNLYYWTSKANKKFRSPPNHLFYPVVYISYFSAIAYNNWLSTQHKISLSYTFDPLPNKATRKTTKSKSFRLPTRDEWKFSAQAGKELLTYPWEQIPYSISDNDLEKVQVNLTDPKSLKLIDNITTLRNIYKEWILSSGKTQSPVLSDEPNSFGITGMMGNVKEWCHDILEKNHTLETQVGKIAGATGFLYADSFSYNYTATLFAKNTNPDVGFRVAMTLGDEELETLRSRKNEISTIL